MSDLKTFELSPDTKYNYVKPGWRAVWAEPEELSTEAMVQISLCCVLLTVSPGSRVITLAASVISIS